ncbi:Occludin_ELL domain-containing protein [Cephalotus follicularis]|uniref:Occludin_ELL domain-containing protein n=1 Tax=Cephalotus follicularis TaxID=3775 RepID=A0A1Q3CJH6_CEPFO|nr:Occludin_ELL domain-containing protein [Cephalotus follicularis]
MYGGSSKLGRGGGRGGSSTGANRNRSSFPPPSHRPSSSGRPSPAPRNNTNTNSLPGPTSKTAPATEENYSLVSGNNPLAFAMIIRLAPDLVEEIKRVESLGGNAKIKFDSIATNPNGNVINVGGKEFRFTWSREPGDLCDIYEERQSGEDGNGLLVESGSSWRKLNVQRVLDESTKNHVKKRSEEAERKSKSRKAIVLDHGNPSMKSQLKQLAAVEANPWKNFKQKKESPFKKRKVDPPQVGAPPKPSYKSGLVSTVNAKVRLSASPLPSPPEQSGAPASPIGAGNISKVHGSGEDAAHIPVKTKEIFASFEKEIPTRSTSLVRETPMGRGIRAKPMDLQSMLITLLKENPKGMSLKALEKAIGDTPPNSAKKIEPIIKKIATFQAPGRYLLKSGVDLESFRKASSECGSSPEENFHPTPAPEDNQDHTSAGKFSAVELEERVELNSKLEEESNALGKLDIQECSPDLFGEKKVSDEGHAGSSSDSSTDSDSDSDSSDSGSESGSQSRSRSKSKSRSPVGSGSGSSSDSETDASSHSKDGSDEDVDIMSDDDKEPNHKIQASEPIQWRPGNAKPAEKGIDEKQDDGGSDAIDIEGHESDAIDIEDHGSDVDIERVLPDDAQEIEVPVNTNLVPNNDREKPVGGSKNFSSDHDELLERQNFIGNLFDDKDDMFKDNLRQERSDSSERITKSKSKRDSKQYDKKSERTKRLRAESLTQPTVSGSRNAQYSESPRNLSPNRLIEDTYRGAAMHMMNIAGREGNADLPFQKGYNQAFAGKSSSDSHRSGQRSSEHNQQSKAHDMEGRPNKYGESSGHGRKFAGKNSHAHEDFSIQKENASRDAQNEGSFAKKVPRNPKEGGTGGKRSADFESHSNKSSEITGKSMDAGQISSSRTGYSPKGNSRTSVDRVLTNGQSSVLRREVSELELGELRDPLPEETLVKKQIDRKVKHSENRPSTSDSDLSKGRPIGKGNPKKPSPPNPNTCMGHRIEDMTRSQHRVVQSQPQHLSGVDHPEVGSQFNRSADASSKSRQNEGGPKQGIGLEGYSESHKKAPASALQQHDTRRGQVSHSLMESKKQTTNAVADLNDGRKDTIMTEYNNGYRKMRESSSDDESRSFSKYEKDAPELKGPIKEFVQYKEYLQEYHEKYDSYCSLNKILETYRKEFHKMGKDLDNAKGRDRERYHKILEQLKESYRRCGARHKRLKKIFIVLHEELKHLKQRIKEFALTYTKD